MQKTLIALAVAVAIGGATPALADGVRDLFKFEFLAAGPDRHIGTDVYTHHNDFRHYSDYYVVDGYTDPNRYTTCRESWVRDDEGRSIQRIQCYGKSPRGPVPGK